MFSKAGNHPLFAQRRKLILTSISVWEELFSCIYLNSSCYNSEWLKPEVVLTSLFDTLWPSKSHHLKRNKRKQHPAWEFQNGFEWSGASLPPFLFLFHFSLSLLGLPLLVLFPFPFFSSFFSWSSSEAYHHSLRVFFALQPSHKAEEFAAWSLSVKKKSFLSEIFITGHQDAAFLLKKTPQSGLSIVTLAVNFRGCFSSLWTKSYNPKMLKMK